MYVTPSAPLSIGGVIDDGIRLYRESFRRCWLLTFLPALAFGVWGIILARNLPGYVNPYSISPAGQMALARQHPLSGGMILYLVVLSLLSISFQGALAARQAALARGDESFTLGRAFATGFLRLPTFILSAILVYLAMMGLIAAVMFVIALPAGILLNRLHVVTRVAAPIGIGVLFFAAILAFMGRVQLFMAAIYIDREGPLASLKTSWRLTKGHWWRAMAILTTAMIILMVLYLALSIVSFLGGYLTHNGPVYRFAIAPLVLVATYTVIYPLVAAIWVAMYNDFKLRREGGDLAARVGTLNTA